MPVRKRSVPSSPSTENEGEEMGEALVKENPRHSSPPPDTTTDRGWWKRRKREGGVSFSIGRRVSDDKRSLMTLIELML